MEEAHALPNADAGNEIAGWKRWTMADTIHKVIEALAPIKGRLLHLYCRIGWGIWGKSRFPRSIHILSQLIRLSI